MPRRLKKLESNEAPVSRAESVPGPSPDKKKVAAKVREALRSHQESAEADVLMDTISTPSQPKPEKKPAMDTFQKSFQKKYDAAYRRFDEAVVRQLENPSDENDQAVYDARLEAERLGSMLVATNDFQKNLDASKAEGESRKAAKAEAERVKNVEEWGVQNTQGAAESVEKYNRASAEDAERRRIIAESRKALEEYKKNQTKEEEEGYPIDITVEKTISQRDLDQENPRLRNIMGKITRVEQDLASAADRLSAFTHMSAEESYEKMILNDRWVRLKRGLATLTAGPVYKILDEWSALGHRLENLKAELQEKRGRVVEESKDDERLAAATYRRANTMPSMENEKAPIAEMDLDLDITQGTKEMEAEREIQKSVNRGKRMAKIEAAKKEPAPISAEDQEIAKIEEDYRANIVRDEQGGIIKSEKKIRAKRPESRVRISGRSNDRPSAAEAASSRAAMLQPTEVAFEPRASEAEENLVRQYQESRKDQIAEVRSEYPRAAEIWNSIQKRLTAMDAESVIALRKLYGTIDVSTAYVIDRAFYDLNGDQEAKQRLDEADKLLGIEDISPKKQVRPKVSKKAA